MRNKECPTCKYPLHRDNHPYLGSVKFCRRSCIAKWHEMHGVPDHHRDEVPVTGNRRYA